MKKYLIMLFILFYTITLKAQSEMGFDTLILRASRSYKPSKSIDDTRNFTTKKTFKIPAYLRVTSGNAGNHQAVLE
ncbi:MAG: hypothetical protein K2X86_06365, partial [Cytophagaceae bacterium]|nr:hypothetical protein [Cytophagaceae bacterium]